MTGNHVCCNRIAVSLLAAICLVAARETIPAAAAETKQPKEAATPATDLVKRCKAATALVNVTGYGSGTAFCVSADGLFVTNRHVIEAAAIGGKVQLVLNPTEASEKVYEAKVVRKDDDADLALLKISGADKLPYLELGDDADVQETAPMTMFGYPFGRRLAVQGERFPSITVNVGKVSALRKKQGKLEVIQLDAALNPGNSGGPVVDERGRLVGVISSGIARSGVVFAIPKHTVREFLSHPGLVVSVPKVAYVNRAMPARFAIELVQFGSFEPVTGVTLTIHAGNEAPRTVDAAADGDHFVATVAPFPAARVSKKLQLLIEQGGEPLVVETDDQMLTVGAKPLRLSEIRLVQNRPATSIVTTLDGRKFVGAVSDWKPLITADGGPIDPGGSPRIDVRVIDPDPATISVEAAADYRGEALTAAQTVELLAAPANAAESPFDPSDPFALPIRTLSFELLVDPNATIRVTPLGIVFDDPPGKPPAQVDDPTRQVVVNGLKWSPQWGAKIRARADAGNLSLYPLRIGVPTFDWKVLSIRTEREGRHTPGHGQVTVAQADADDDDLAITIDDPGPGPGWYRIYLNRRLAVKKSPRVPDRTTTPRGGRWTFEDEDGQIVRDVSGNESHGLIATPALVLARGGKALSFQTGSVDCGDVGYFDRGDAFSYGAWVYPTGFGDMTVLARMDEQQGNRGYDVDLQSGTVNIHLISHWDQDAIRVNSVERMLAFEWHHLLVTYDGKGLASGVRLYVDGRAVELQTLNDNLQGSLKTPTHFRIGARSAGGAGYGGLIDDAVLYDRTLSPAEARRLTAADGTSPTGPVDDSLAKGLVARWTFEDADSRNIADVSGHRWNAHGDSGLTPPTRTPGKSGEALQLFGRGGVDCGQTADFDRGDRFSYGAWVRPASTGPMTIVSKMDQADPKRGFDLMLHDGQVLVHLISAWDGQVTRRALRVVSRSRVPADEWRHLLVTYDGTSRATGLKLYIDGKPADVEVTDDSLNGTIRTPAPLLIGSRVRGHVFHGLIDEVAIYARTLSVEEVAALVAGKLPPE